MFATHLIPAARRRPGNRYTHSLGRALLLLYAREARKRIMDEGASCV
jgi:hypothetical protein